MKGTGAGPRTRACKWMGAVAAAMWMSACASGQTYQELQASMPPIPAGQGRIFVYLPGSSEVVQFFPQLTLDGQQVGELKIDTFVYFDRPAGMHEVGVYVPPVSGAFGAQGKTTPVVIELAPGEQVYVQANTLATVGMVTVTLTPESPADGQRDLQPLYLAPPPK